MIRKAFNFFYYGIAMAILAYVISYLPTLLGLEEGSNLAMLVLLVYPIIVITFAIWFSFFKLRREWYILVFSRVFYE